ncbi:hypothetical protein [Pseudodesulfovibrio sp.]|uniref:hypothetical protein n=1 Tax=unclassified Pseudodesulfovibrio TaxID=2661612 RepID=UPI003AFFFF65
MLYHLQKVFSRRSTFLLNAFLESSAELLADSQNQKARILAEMCVLRIHDEWCRFCRELIIVSAMGLGRTASGHRVPRASGMYNIQCVQAAFKRGRPNWKFEPSWAVTNDCLKAAQKLGITNFNTIAASLGAQNSHADDLRVVRNFFAHRNKSTALQIQSKPWCNAALPLNVESLLLRLATGGVFEFEKWVGNVKLISELAIQ